MKCDFCKQETTKNCDIGTDIKSNGCSVKDIQKSIKVKTQQKLF